MFFGGGAWMPPPALLNAVRTRIADQPAAWKKAIAAPALVETYGGLGDGHPLARPPRGFPPEHPCIFHLHIETRQDGKL